MLLLLMIVFLLLIIICYLLLLIIVIDDYLLLLMIICYCNKTNFSSSVNEVIRPVFFLTIRFYKYKKALKSIKKH